MPGQTNYLIIAPEALHRVASAWAEYRKSTGYNTAVLLVAPVQSKAVVIRDLIRRVRAGALIVHGRGDRLVRVEAARALVAERPDWRLEVLDDIGHVPQLEAPERFLALVEPWVAGRTAA